MSRRRVAIGGSVNMIDVAREAGVSVATVSRALRDMPGVSHRNRERIRRIAEELSYVVSPQASSLSRGRTGRVAVVVPRLDNWFASTMTAIVEAAVRRAGHDVLLYQVDGEAARSRFFRDLPTRRKVDAVVLVALPILPAEEDRLDLMGVQVVVAGGRLRDFPFTEVDDVAVARAATRHLLDLGHTRIAMIRTSDTDGARWTSDAHRQQGFRETVVEHGLGDSASSIVTETYGVGAGAAAMRQLLDADDPPTAVFCYSDDIAVSALRAAHERGIRVPEDLSLIGVDGNPLAELFGLTTIDQHVPRQARLAGEMAALLVAGTPLATSAYQVDHHLVLRDSTAPPPSGR